MSDGDGEATPQRNRIFTTAIVGVVVLLIVGVVGVVVVQRVTAKSAGSASAKPNIVMIMADDQTLEEMRVLDNTRKLIGEQGTTFSRYYASFPNCCPSRATYLTGQYSHNNGVRDNLPPLGGARKLKDDETLPVWLQRAGYNTVSVGKYLNTWGDDGNITPPPGWNRWFGLIDPSTYKYYGYSVSIDGQRKDYGSDPADYQTDVLGAEVVNSIQTQSKAGKPFFLSFTPLAPHVEAAEGTPEFGFISPGPVPAPRHVGRFANEPLPITPSYDQADVDGMPNFVRFRTRLTKSGQQLATENYRKELETLLALDEAVAKIIQSLKDTGVYDNTVVMFTSDNGLFHGEHRIPNGKLYLYEPATHLPLLISGPGFAKGATVSQPVGNVDLAPTIAAMAGATPAITEDGRDVRGLLADAGVGAGRGLLLENQLGGRLRSEAIHTERYFYAEHSSGDKELYDLQVDPDQINNVVDAPRYAFIKNNLAARLQILRSCAGTSCEGADPAAEVAEAPKPLLAKPGQTDPPHTAPPTTRPPDAILDAKIKGAVATVTAHLEMSTPERDCLVDLLKRDPGLLDTGDVPAMQDMRSGGSLVIVLKYCVSPTKFGTFLKQLLGFLTAGQVDQKTAGCFSEVLTALDNDQFARVLRYLADPRSKVDQATRDLTVKLLQDCGVDPQKLVF